MPFDVDGIKREVIEAVVRVPCYTFSLFVHIHCHAGLEFHVKFILITGDLFNQPLDSALHFFRPPTSRWWAFFNAITVSSGIFSE